jgi:small subunit ribosomal protein S1
MITWRARGPPPAADPMEPAEKGGDRMSSWEEFTERYGVGDVLDGRVTKVVPFGALMEVADGVPGLLVETTSAEPGSRVPVRIAEIDTEKHRVRLETP